MSAKALSPAANLLRHSRLMAVPAPVAPPTSYHIFARNPPPYPTMQAITAPRSSANRGEWGLKRDLPVKTSTEIEYVRYEDLDTINHMTTFESAHDDVYTVKKWQEMDIPISKDSRYGSSYGNEVERFTSTSSSVFDSDTKAESYKWRYSGPYVPDMSPRELQEYIKTKIIPRKQEFYDYVAARQNRDELETRYKKNGDTVTEEQLNEEAAKMPQKPVDLMALRANTSRLETLVMEFLDIPRVAPHQTHPSAGLHYTRSWAHVVNDPELGPQEKPKPIPGRFMSYQGGLQSVGVGGVVASLMQPHGKKEPKDRAEVQKFVPLKGTSISPRGKISLDVEQVGRRSLMGVRNEISRVTTEWKSESLNRQRERIQSSNVEREKDTDAILNILSNIKFSKK